MGNKLLKGSTYHERDYTFGQIMLTARTRIGLTQSGLAKILGVFRKAMGDWEPGRSYPQGLVFGTSHSVRTALS